MTAVELPRWEGWSPCQTTSPDDWFPELGASTAAVKRLCLESCPRRMFDQCRSYAITHNVTGIWGGLSDKERQQMRRRHGINLRESA